METRNFFSFFFVSLCIGLVTLVLLFTWGPYTPPYATDLLDCTTNSAWCASKNRFQSKPPNSLVKNKNHHNHNHASDAPHHPLDPLTVQELNKIRTILSSHALFKSSSPYALHSIELEEPDKPLVLRWKKGDPLLPRKASVVARASGKSHVLTVDLTTSEVSVHQSGSNSGYPMLTMEDVIAAASVPLVNAKFNRSIIERGVDLTDLACLPVSSGWFGEYEENRRRLIKVQCYSVKDTVNFYMRPIRRVDCAV